jgi:hypothetical protein
MSIRKSIIDNLVLVFLFVIFMITAFRRSPNGVISGDVEGYYL